MKLEIYGRPGCPYCVKAKDLGSRLQAGGFFQEVIYHDYPAEGLSKDNLSEIAKTPIKTVPVVLVNGTFIGGFSDLSARFPGV